MGRLTLNVLLSFAQFEREVTAERIRDKIAASKKKGLWMGGSLPLGYDRHPDPQRRDLVVNGPEAEVVRQLFTLYDDRGNLRLVEIEAARLGLRSKALVSASGRSSGGSPFTRGQLHYLLTNPVYIGRIRHKDLSYPGQHPAIIDESLWDSVQAILLLLAESFRVETLWPSRFHDDLMMFHSGKPNGFYTAQRRDPEMRLTEGGRCVSAKSRPT